MISTLRAIPGQQAVKHLGAVFVNTTPDKIKPLLLKEAAAVGGNSVINVRTTANRGEVHASGDAILVDRVVGARWDPDEIGFPP